MWLTTSSSFHDVGTEIMDPIKLLTQTKEIICPIKLLTQTLNCAILSKKWKKLEKIFSTFDHPYSTIVDQNPDQNYISKRYFIQILKIWWTKIIKDWCGINRITISMIIIKILKLIYLILDDSVKIHNKYLFLSN